MSECLSIFCSSALFSSFSNRYEEEINRRTTVENEFVALKKVRSSNDMDSFTCSSYFCEENLTEIVNY